MPLWLDVCMYVKIPKTELMVIGPLLEMVTWILPLPGTTEKKPRVCILPQSCWQWKSQTKPKRRHFNISASQISSVSEHCCRWKSFITMKLKIVGGKCCILYLCYFYVTFIQSKYLLLALNAFCICIKCIFTCFVYWLLEKTKKYIIQIHSIFVPRCNSGFKPFVNQNKLND